MGLLGDLLKGILSSVGVGRMSLADAKVNAPNAMGCYKIYHHGELKYVGKAEDGLRKRFVQYYNGTTAHYPSAKKIFECRDEITITFAVLPSREDCRRVEREWIESCNPEWNKQRGWQHD